MKKVGLITLVIVLALGAMGVGYAAWSQTLTISGTVHTGKVDVAWSIEGVGDYDYSSVNATKSSDGHTMYVHISDACPGIPYYVYFNIENTGSIPVVIQDFNVDPGSLPEEAIVTCGLDEEAPWQIEPTETKLGTLMVFMWDDPEQDHEYTFSVDVQAIQFNAVVPEPE